VFDVHAETLTAQVHPDEFGDGPFVLHDEHEPLARRIGHPTHDARTGTVRMFGSGKAWCRCAQIR
jgi:hypothetical protein